MSIRVIQQDTNERQKETEALFNECRPYLDRGMSLRKAVKESTGRVPSNVRSGWFRELIEYAQTQGYEYKRWSRGR